MKILLGMSGGVDSCAAAKLLQEQGFTVVGCSLLLTPHADKDSEEINRARQAADRLGIELVIADRRARFRQQVIDPFARAYAEGSTPNPCIVCNPSVKIASLCEEADRLGIEAVATGHYARIDRSGRFPRLQCAPSPKDQSYFLYRLPPDFLKRLHFPLGSFTDKQSVRALAEQAGMEAAAKAADSQEICFLPDGDYAAFLIQKLGIKAEPGPFLDLNGNRIGEHRGILYYTPGQRKGLGAFGKPMYVKAVCPADNSVILCAAEERFTDTLTAADLNWCSGEAPDNSFDALVKIRSAAKAAPAHIEISNGTAFVQFENKQMAPARGQSAVFYDGDFVLGGGFIR